MFEQDRFGLERSYFSVIGKLHDDVVTGTEEEQLPAPAVPHGVHDEIAKQVPSNEFDHVRNARDLNHEVV